MKILITGGAGFIGSHLARALRKKGHRVAIFDNYDRQVHGPGKPPGQRQSVLNYPELKRALSRAEAVVHFAAAVGVGQSQYQIKHYVDTNIGGTGNLLDIMANHRNKVHKLIVAGSMSAYGEGTYRCKKCGRVRPELRPVSALRAKKWDPQCPQCRRSLTPVPIHEKDPFICSSIYAVTKMTQEELVMNFGAAYGIPVTSLRFFNVHGPGQSLSNPYTGVAAIFMSRIKNGNRPLVYEDGEQTRDFVSVHDIVQACSLALHKKKANQQVFNVGTGKPTSILELSERLIRIFGSKVKPQVVGKYRKGDIRHCFADIRHIREELGYKPRVKLDDGLREIIGWAHGIKAVDQVDLAHKELTKRGLV